MKLVMLKTTRGAIDGINILEYKEGHEYSDIELGKLFKIFLDAGAAEIVKPMPEPVMPEPKPKSKKVVKPQARKRNKKNEGGKK